MTTTAQNCEQHCQQSTELAQDDYGALAYMLTFEEIDDAIDVLERIISAREAEDKAIRRYNSSAQGGLALNTELNETIDQLRAERLHRAIPEAVMDAAIAELEGTTEDHTQDDEGVCECGHH